MDLRLKQLGLRDYREVWVAMREFTETRGAETVDELWLVEHPPVYTLGRNGDPAQILFSASEKAPPSIGGNNVELMRHSGMDRRNPDSMDGSDPEHPCSLDSGDRCRNDEQKPVTTASKVEWLGKIPIVESDRGGQVTYHGPGQLIAYTLFDLNRLGIGIRSLVSGLENAVINTLLQYGIKAEARRDAPGVYVDGKKIASLGLRIRKGCSYHGLSLNVDMDLSPFSAINPCGYPGLEITQLVDMGVPVKTYEVAVPLVGAIMREFGFKDVLGSNRLNI